MGTIFVQFMICLQRLATEFKPVKVKSSDGFTQMQVDLQVVLSRNLIPILKTFNENWNISCSKKSGSKTKTFFKCVGAVIKLFVGVMHINAGMALHSFNEFVEVAHGSKNIVSAMKKLSRVGKSIINFVTKKKKR